MAKDKPINSGEKENNNVPRQTKSELSKINDEINKFSTSPNSLLKIESSNPLTLNEILSERVRYLIEKRKINCKNVLIFTTSRRKAKRLQELLKDCLIAGSEVEVTTVSDFINKFLKENYPEWIYLNSSNTSDNPIHEISKQMGKPADNKLKNAIQELSIVKMSVIEKKTKQELLDLYKFTKKECIRLKSIIGKNKYVSENKMIDKLHSFLGYTAFMSNYKFIGTVNLPKFSVAKVKFILRCGKDKHSTFTIDRNLKSTTNFKTFVDCIDKKSKKYTIKKIDMPDLKELDVNIEELDNSNQKNNPANITFNKNPLIENILKLFNNHNIDSAFLNLLIMIPGVDKFFMKGLINIISTSGLSVYEFIEKYHDVFANEQLQVILSSILNFLNKLPETMNVSDAKSIIENVEKFAKTVNPEMNISKEDLTEICEWLKEYEKNTNVENLVKFYYNRQIQKSDDAEILSYIEKKEKQYEEIKKGQVKSLGDNAECNAKNTINQDNNSNNLESEQGINEDILLNKLTSNMVHSINGNVQNLYVSIKTPECIKFSYQKSPRVTSMYNPKPNMMQHVSVRRSSSITSRSRPISWHGGNTVMNITKKLV